MLEVGHKGAGDKGSAFKGLVAGKRHVEREPCDLAGSTTGYNTDTKCYEKFRAREGTCNWRQKDFTQTIEYRVAIKDSQDLNLGWY